MQLTMNLYGCPPPADRATCLRDHQGGCFSVRVGQDCGVLLLVPACRPIIFVEVPTMPAFGKDLQDGVEGVLS